MIFAFYYNDMFTTSSTSEITNFFSIFMSGEAAFLMNVDFFLIDIVLVLFSLLLEDCEFYCFLGLFMLFEAALGVDVNVRLRRLIKLLVLSFGVLEIARFYLIILLSYCVSIIISSADRSSLAKLVRLGPGCRSYCKFFRPGYILLL